MSNLLHVCLYNTEPASSAALRGAIRTLNFVRIIAEVGTAEDLAVTLKGTEVNLIFFHLDPDARPVVEVIDQVASRYPELALVAVSHQTGPEAILAPMRAGCDQFVCEPIDHADLATAIGRVASKRLFSQPKCRRICVTGASGGAGTTSIACNLALEIAQLTDRECALIDLDLQFGDVALSFDCEPEFTFHDLAQAGADLDRSVLSSALKKLPSKVAILSRPEMLEQQEAVTADTIHRVIELLVGSYENIIIDVPRDLNQCTTAAFAQADIIFIVCQLLVPSIRNAKRYYEALLRIGVPDERLQFVVNRGDGRSGRVTIKDLEETTRRPIYACIPNDYQFVARSIDFGRPIASLDRSSPVRAAIAKMAEKITAEPRAEATEKKERRGLFSRLRAK